MAKSLRGGYPSLMPSFERNLLTQRHQITSLETKDSRLSYGDNPESLSNLGLIRYRVVTPHGRPTDGQTDRIAIANTRSAVPVGTAVARNHYITTANKQINKKGY